MILLSLDFWPPLISRLQRLSPLQVFRGGGGIECERDDALNAGVKQITATAR